MKYHVFSDGKSWVMVAQGSSSNTKYSVSTISADGVDRFSLKKGIKCAVARQVIGLSHPQTETVAALVFDSPMGLSVYWVGEFTVDNVLERLARRMFSVFSKQYTWKNGKTIVWRAIDEVASFLVVRKIKPVV